MPGDPDSYFVEYRSFSVSRGERLKMEGVYHLSRLGGSWKVEDVYIAAVNGERLPHWVPVSELLPFLDRQGELDHPRNDLARGVAARQKNPRAARDESVWDAARRSGAQEAAKQGVAWLFSPRGKATVLAILVPIGGGPAVLWRKLTGARRSAPA